MSVGLLIVVSLVLLAVFGNKRATGALRWLFWAFIALVLLMLVGIAVSVW